MSNQNPPKPAAPQEDLSSVVASLAATVKTLQAQISAKDDALEMLKSLAAKSGIDPDSLPERMKRLDRERKPQLQRRFPNQKSHDTASTFTIRVVKSDAPGFEHGRIVELMHYRWPEGFDVSVQLGGLMPEGYNTSRKPDGTYNIRFASWLYETFWLADYHRYLKGRALRSVDLADPTDLSKPWRTHDECEREEAAEAAE